MLKLGGKKIIFFILIFLLTVSAVWAVDYTWNGASTTWNLNSNWLPNTGFPGVGDTATINAVGTYPVLTLNVSVDRLTLAGGATISGAGDITVSGTGTSTIAGNISLPGNTVSITSDDVEIDGSVNVTTGTINITTTGDLTGTGFPALTADTIDISGVAGTIGTSGAAPLRTASGSPAACDLSIPTTGGVLFVEHAGDLNTIVSANRNISSEVSIVASGDLTVGPSAIDTIDSDLTLQGDTVALTGRLAVGDSPFASGTLTLTATGATPTVTTSASIRLENGSTLNVTGDFTTTGNNFRLYQASSATFTGDVILNNSGDTDISTGSITMNGDGDLYANDPLTPDGDLIISGGFTVTLTSNITVDDLTVNGILITTGQVLTANSISGNGTIIPPVALSWDGGGAGDNWDTPNNWNPNMIPASGADITIGAFTVDINSSPTVNDLTLTGTTANLISTLTVNGNYQNTGTFNAGTDLVIFNGNGDLACGGAGSAFYDLTISGIVNLTEDLYVSRNLTIDGTLNAAGNNIFVGGNWTNNVTFTHGGGTGTVIFNGGATSVINGTSATTFNNLTVTNTTTLNLTGLAGLTVNNTFTNNGTVLADNGLTFTGGTFTSGGSSLVNYSGAGTTGLPFGNSYQSVTFSAGAWNLNNTLTVAGNLTVSGATLNGNTQTQNITGNLNINSGGATLTDGTINVGGTFGLDTTLNITGGGALNVNSTSNISGTFTNGSSLTTFTGDVINSGILAFNDAGNLVFSGNYSGGTGAINGSGTGNPQISFAGNVALGSYTANGDSILVNGTVNQNFNSAGSTVSNIAVNKTGGILFITTNLNTTNVTLTNADLRVNNGVQWTIGSNLAIGNNASVTLISNSTLTDGPGSRDIDVTGTGVLNVQNGSTLTIDDLSLDNSADVDIGTGTFTVNNLIVTNGNFSFNGPNILAHTVGGYFQQTGGIVSLDDSILTINGNYTQTGGTPDTNSGTIVMGGSSANTIESADGVFNLTIDDDTAILNQALDINGTLNLDGNFDASGYNINIAGTWDHDSGTFTSGGGGQTVIFDNNLVSPATVNCDHDSSGGWGNFNNVTIANGARVTLNGGEFNVNGTLSIGTSTGLFTGNPRSDLFTTYLDVAERNFTINNFTNFGAFRLNGTQATQNINGTNYLNADGWVEYYGATATLNNGYFADLFNLRIASGTYTLGQSITVNGNTVGVDDRDGNGRDFDDEGLFIIGGNLTDPTPFAAPPQVSTYTITIYENFYVNDLGGATFTPGSGQVTLEGPGDWFIDGGDVPFYNLTCNRLWDPSVSKDIYFRLNERISISGTIYLRGDTSNAPSALVPLDTDPDSENTGYLKLRPVTTPAPLPAPPVFWFFDSGNNAILDMEQVCIWYSDARSNSVIVPPPTTRIFGCEGWLIYTNVTATETVDIDGNGKIDHLRITSAVNLRQTGTPFSNFTAVVSGYDIDDYLLDLPTDSGAGNDRIFYIKLVEKPYLDTGVTPSWEITTNSTLLDLATFSARVRIEFTTMTATDTAPPVIGYTLAVEGKDEIFIHFSEPVVNNLGGALLDSDFNLVAPSGATVSGIDNISGSGPGYQEFLLYLSFDLTAADILTPAILSVSANITDTAPTANPLRPLPLENTHRVTDLGLGLVSLGLIEPVVGQDQTLTTEASGVGICNSFDGSDWLKPEDITLQIFSDDLGSFDLIYQTSGNIGSSFRVRDMWLPSFNETDYSGLVGYPLTTTATESPSLIVGNLFDFDIPGSDSRIKDGVDFEFFLVSPGNIGDSPLYCGRVEDDGASDWYRHVGPWKFKLRDIIQQKGGISILNNIFDPTKGEKVSVHMNLNSSTMILIQVFDLAGGLVRVIQRGTLPAGENIITWDGRNNSGNVCARGVYFVRVNGEDIDEMRKVLLKK